MCMFEFIFFDLLYTPLYNLLIFFYAISPGKDMGLAVIFLTVFIRVLLLPLSIRSARSQYRLAKIRPTIEAIEKKYRHNAQKQRDQIKGILRENKISIFGNFFSLLFQLLFFVVLYAIFSSGLQEVGHNTLYFFNLDPGVIDPYFVGRFNLIIPHNGASIFAGAVVFFGQVIKKIRHLQDLSTIERALIIGLPIGTYLATIILPSAKALFIATTALFSLWLTFVRWFVLKYVLKDEELKANVKSLWTS